MQITKKQQSYQNSEKEDKNGHILRESFLSEFYIRIVKTQIIQRVSMSADLIMLLVFKAIIEFHSLISYFLTNPSTRQACSNYLGNIYGQPSISILLQTVLYCLELAQLFAVYNLLTAKGQDSIHKFNKIIINNFSLLAELDLSLSGILLLIDFEQNIGGFIIAVCLYLFNVLFLINYYNKRDILYFSSIKGSFFLHMAIVINYFINSICNNYYPESFIFANTAFVLIISIWYCKSGYNLIPNRVFKLLLKQIIIFKLSNSLIFLQYIINSHQISFQNYLVKFILSYIIVTITFSKVLSFECIFEYCIKQKDLRNLKYFDLLLTLILDQEQNLSTCQRHYLVSSVIKYHKDIQCLSCNISKIKYDPIEHIYSSASKPNRQVELKYYLKCLYEESINSNIKDSQFILDYCQFIWNEFSNPYILSKWLSTIELFQIGFWCKLRLHKLKTLIRSSIQSLNKIVFDGKLELQNMMTAQQSFDKIEQNVETYIRMSIQVWELIQQSSINYTEVKEKINISLELIQSTNQQWLCISKYLPFQKRWKYIYINYASFILNQQIKNKDLEELREMDQNDYFTEENIIFNDNEKRSTLVHPRILFDKSTIYLRAAIKEDSLKIVSISKYFNSFLEYNDGQIIGCSIDILMDTTLREAHRQKVKQWLENGYSNNDVFYNPRFTHLVTKFNREVPIVKYYKLFISVQAQSELQSICLLKINSTQTQFFELQSQFQEENDIPAEDFSTFFNSKKQKSIKIQNNIFIKDQDLQTNQRIQEIQLSKIFIRILTCSIIFLLIVMAIIINRDTKILNNNITQFLNFLNLYRFPMALSKNYMKNFLNLGTQSSVINQIKFGTQNVIAFNSDPLTLKTLFDQTLNEGCQYHPFLNDSFNEGISYNQIQIYSLVISNIISLSKLPINRTGYDFTMLNMYLVPSFDHMMNKTKIKFHETFQNNLNYMLKDQIVIAVVELIVFGVIISFVFIQIKAYLRKSRDILQVIFEFSNINVKRIRKYWRKIFKHFRRLNMKNRAYYQSTILNLRSTKGTDINLDIDYIKENIQREQTISFNKKSKVVFETAKAKGKFLKYVIIIGVSLFLLLSALLGVEAFNIVRIQALLRFERDGYYFLEYYPATSVLGHALMERYYNQLYPKEIQFYPQRYAEYISDMKIIGESKYISEATDPSSSYYQKQKNYMFGNPCTFSPQVLVAANSNLAKCLSIYNRTLSNGLSTFLRAAQPQLQSYINRNSTLTSTQLDTLTSALTLVAFYVTDGITTWAAEFSTKVKQFKQTGNIVCILIAILVLSLHLIFCQYLLFYFLGKDYRLVRDIFDKMIPEYILSTEKICRQRLIKQGIIKK